MSETPVVNEITDKLRNTTLGEDEGDTDKPDPNQVKAGGGLFINSTEDAQIITDGSIVNDPLKSTVSFKDLNLTPELLKGIEEMGYVSPSKIQGLAIPVIQKGQNIIGQAQSGTGKTAAFCLGMLSRIRHDLQQPQALCVSPTRELAMQTFDVLSKLSKFTTVQPFLLIPDVVMPQQITNQIIVGTPGKFLDCLEKRRNLNTKNVMIFVLDEADQMFLDSGKNVNSSNQAIAQKIISKLPVRDSSKRVVASQMCFFSATFSESVQQFVESHVPQPTTRIYIPPNKLSIDKLFQYYIKCQGEDARFAVLDSIYQRITNGQSIIFVETRKQAQLVYQRMKAAQHEVSIIHGGDMQTKERDAVMLKFRNGENRILITTNLLSRGIDVLSVALVVNFDLPFVKGANGPEPDYETYLHRIGRSARFGQIGVAINLVYDQNSFNLLQGLKHYFFPTDQTKISELKNDKNDPSVTIDASLQTINEKLEMFAT
jgi:ATP-dependent RNA helicase DDX19/DBP5